MLRLLGCSAALVLAGCVVVPVPATAEKQICRNEALGAFVGRERSEATGNEILKASGAHVVRWVPRGAAVTMEFSAERATAWLDANKRIERVTCG